MYLFWNFLWGEKNPKKVWFLWFKFYRMRSQGEKKWDTFALSIPKHYFSFLCCCYRKQETVDPISTTQAQSPSFSAKNSLTGCIPVATFSSFAKCHDTTSGKHSALSWNWWGIFKDSLGWNKGLAHWVYNVHHVKFQHLMGRGRPAQMCWISCYVEKGGKECKYVLASRLPFSTIIHQNTKASYINWQLLPLQGTMVWLFLNDLPLTPFCLAHAAYRPSAAPPPPPFSHP